MPTPPPKVLRFYRDPEATLKDIKSKKICFKNMNTLNDPFDPNFEIKIDVTYSNLLEHVKKSDPIEYKLFDLSEINFERTLAGIIKSLKSLENKFKDRMLVFSTCEVSNNVHPEKNLYMWGHYADGHRGLAIEFDTGLLTNAILKIGARLNNSKAYKKELWWEIIYDDEPPKLTPDAYYDSYKNYTIIKKVIIGLFEKCFNLKSFAWEREKEWRLVMDCKNKPKKKHVRIFDDTITAIYLGCQMPENKKSLFYSKTKKYFPKADIFEATKTEGRFALNFKPYKPL